MNYIMFDNNNTKDLILKILVSHKELNINEIQKQLKGDFEKKISYQGIRKILIDLIDRDIITKLDNNYIINPAWIDEIRKFIKFYDNKQLLSLNKKSTKIVLNTIEDLYGFFFYELLEKNYIDFKIEDKDDSVFVITDHLLIPFGNSKLRDKIDYHLKKTRMKVIVTKPSFIDKLILRWHTKNCKISFNKKYRNEFHYVISKNCVVQIYINNGLRTRLTEFYNFKGFIKNLKLLTGFLDVFYEKNNIEVSIFRNTNLAKDLRENFEKKFNILD